MLALVAQQHPHAPSVAGFRTSSCAPAPTIEIFCGPSPLTTLNKPIRDSVFFCPRPRPLFMNQNSLSTPEMYPIPPLSSLPSVNLSLKRLPAWSPSSCSTLRPHDGQSSHPRRPRRLFPLLKHSTPAPVLLPQLQISSRTRRLYLSILASPSRLHQSLSQHHHW